MQPLLFNVTCACPSQYRGAGRCLQQQLRPPPGSTVDDHATPGSSRGPAYPSSGAERGDQKKKKSCPVPPAEGAPQGRGARRQTNRHGVPKGSGSEEPSATLRGALPSCRPRSRARACPPDPQATPADAASGTALHQRPTWPSVREAVAPAMCELAAIPRPATANGQSEPCRHHAGWENRGRQLTEGLPVCLRGSHNISWPTPPAKSRSPLW